MSSQLRVVQFNIGSLFEPDWEHRRHEIVAWLRHLSPDVVCLQEVIESPTSPNTAGWIADQLGDSWHWEFAGAEPIGTEVPPETLFGSAVLSCWPITSTQYVRLPVHPKARQGVETFPWELFYVQTADLDLFVTHLAAAPTDGPTRRVQVQAIDDCIRCHRRGIDDFGPNRAAMPAILCGDFNAEPESDEIRFLNGFTELDGNNAFWQDAWRVAGDGSAGFTNDWSKNPIAASMNVHRKRIDYVFVGDPFYRRGSGGRVLSAEIAFHHSLTGGVLASDHFGLVVDIEWPTRPLSTLPGR
jgi:endonuclease/exonuclease/phosphatase family metal-dependent hydrolase